MPPVRTRKFVLWILYAGLLLTVTIFGLEGLSTLVVPAWPARELRPIDALGLSMAALKSIVGPALVPTYNSWGLRDRERSLTKPAAIKFRSVLVGDSFLEGSMVTRPVGQRIESLLSEAGQNDMEAVNLGVSATGPSQYYYRIEKFALGLQPDAIVLNFFSGNDFVEEPYSPWNIPPFVAERPKPSWLGAVAPRLTWLIVNRLGLSEAGNGEASTDFLTINGALDKPPAERLEILTQYVATHSSPAKEATAVRPILARAGDKFWKAFGHRDRDQEFLAGWLLTNMVGSETSDWPVPLTAEEAERTLDRTLLDATLTWIVATTELARKHNVKLMIVLSPTSIIDPLYADFWAPWPHHRGFLFGRQTLHRALRAALEARSIPVVDLEDDLKGRRGTYRLTDGHWNELGTQIAAERIARELLKLRNGKPYDD
jgi:hypothetical protein